MPSEEDLIKDIHRMDDEIAEIIGRPVYGYTSKPTPTTTRVVFGNQHVCLSMAEGHAYMTSLLATAKHNPAELPYPFNEPLTPEQVASFAKDRRR
jgi:hypothetical protein